jgi:hypothetical protein
MIAKLTIIFKLNYYYGSRIHESTTTPTTDASGVPTMTTPEEDSVQFSKLSYLGCTWVKAPRNEVQAQRAMATLRAESAIPIPVILHVPNGSHGSVR